MAVTVTAATRPNTRTTRARYPRARKEIITPPDCNILKPLAPKDSMTCKVQPRQRPQRQVRAQVQQPQPQPQLQLQHYIPPTPKSRIGKVLDGRIVLDSILGVGAYGVVYKARDLQSPLVYAVKALSKFNSNGTPLDQRQHDFQRREIQLHRRASAHRNIVSLYKIIDDVDCTYVIMEFCSEGDLFSNITEHGKYVGNKELIRRVALQIVDAVAFCHNQGIYHRDLKPENILVANNAQEVKLADFGLATEDLTSTDFGCGSTFYMSPECQDQSSRTLGYACAPNDIWSLGVILVNLTCGRNPWKQASESDSTFREYLKDRHFLKTILPLSEEFDHILSLIFELDPSRRISLPELRYRILNCQNFVDPRPYAERRAAATYVPPQAYAPLPTPPASPAWIPDMNCPFPSMESPLVVPHSPSSTCSASSLSSIDTMMSDRSNNSIGSSPDNGAYAAQEVLCSGFIPLSPIDKKAAEVPFFNYAQPPMAFDPFAFTDYAQPQWTPEATQNTFFQYHHYVPNYNVAGY